MEKKFKAGLTGVRGSAALGNGIRSLRKCALPGLRRGPPRTTPLNYEAASSWLRPALPARTNPTFRPPTRQSGRSPHRLVPAGTELSGTPPGSDQTPLRSDAREPQTPQAGLPGALPVSQEAARRPAAPTATAALTREGKSGRGHPTAVTPFREPTSTLEATASPAPPQRSATTHARAGHAPGCAGRAAEHAGSVSLPARHIPGLYARTSGARGRCQGGRRLSSTRMAWKVSPRFRLTQDCSTRGLSASQPPLHSEARSALTSLFLTPIVDSLVPLRSNADRIQPLCTLLHGVKPPVIFAGMIVTIT
ncbi:uncharacterized protein DKFZp434B061-like [Pongo pygmaeus]|uniref:uncharacterized protein DKFZp434B061-like n=1 Tax=Pongo pygmaeus TaxID=9600 RepID=UPI00300D4673